MTSARRRIAIIGAGFSGTSLAVQLLRRLREPVDLLLFDGRGSFGRGLAYATRNPRHLLNVRVANMSAFEDDPQHFIRWLWQHEGEDSDGPVLPIPPSGHAFVSRARYGAYLEDVFRGAIDAAQDHVRVKCVALDVVALDSRSAGLALTLSDGTVRPVDCAVLCTGNFSPAPPFPMGDALRASPVFIGNPWDWLALDWIERDEKVLVIGTGLTTVDFVLELDARGHRGPIVALSRRGLLPLTHELTRPYPPFLAPDSIPPSLLGQLRRVRAEIRRAARDGYDWRSVMDSLRPLVQELWTALSEPEQRRFLRHLRPYWDVHRHRMAPEVASRIEALRASGRLTIAAGRVLAADLEDGAAHLELRLRNENIVVALEGAWLVNCSGPECDYARAPHPLMRQLISSGVARPDPLSLGLDVADGFALHDCRGNPSRVLFALGPPTRGALWEITAVPDIRKQSATLADRLVRQLAPA